MVEPLSQTSPAPSASAASATPEPPGRALSKADSDPLKRVEDVISRHTPGAPPSWGVPVSGAPPAAPGGGGGHPLTTWHSAVRPTRLLPLRDVKCDGCDGCCKESDPFFPKEYRRWGYYLIVPRLDLVVRQPSGWWCWECDTLTEGQPEDKNKLRTRLMEETEYKRVWNEEWIPKQRVQRGGRARAGGWERIVGGRRGQPTDLGGCAPVAVVV